jgi:hypothetical protein
MEVQVNTWAVVAAMVSSMVVGSIWYARSVFGNTWMKLARVEGDGGSVVRPIVTTMIVSLITAYVLAHVSYLSNQFFQNSFLQDAVTTAFWMWLGFTAARFITHDAFEGRPMKLTLINIANELVTFLVMGAIIGYMGV